jgi:uncharacterized repeat protein (TIGR01451 family)
VVEPLSQTQNTTLFTLLAPMLKPHTVFARLAHLIDACERGLQAVPDFVLWLLFAAVLWLCVPDVAKANDLETTSYRDVAAGAYIVDMGQGTQTIANGLKPYGLVYELIVTRKVPVLWVINPSKTKVCLVGTCADGVDLVADGKSYAGGTFVIAPEFVDAGVLASITTWRGKGVVVDGPTATATSNVPVYSALTSVPRVALDTANGAIAAAYLNNAEIPASAYTLKTPAQVNGCDDIFVMPHADPTWATHGALLGFVTNFKGYVWAACHSVSVLESLVDPTNSSNRLNFLSSNGLVPFGSHAVASPPYDYLPSAGHDPVMQFINRTDGAHLNGSEQVYLPTLTSQWRAATTVVAEFDASHPDVPGKSGGPAAVIVYGRAFGSGMNGKVMYEGGHDHNKTGTVAEKVAAQRAFLNFILMAGIDHRPDITATVPSSADSAQTINIDASISGGAAPYSVLWTSSCGGSFANATSASTSFTAPAVGANTACVLRVSVLDTCGRKNFAAQGVAITAGVAVPPQVVGVAQSAGTPVRVAAGVFDVPYTVTVKNLGAVGLSNLQLSSDLVAVFPAPLTWTVQSAAVASPGLSANAAFNGNGNNNLLAGSDALGVGASGSVKFTVRVSVNGSTGTSFAGSALATSAATVGGAALSSDLSNNGDGTAAGDLAAIDPNNNGNPGEAGENTPTPVNLPAAVVEHPLIGVAKRVQSQSLNADGSTTVVFEVTVKNHGDVPLLATQISDDLSLTVPAARASFVVLAAPQLDPACTALSSAASAFTGSGVGANLLTASATNPLAVGAVCKLVYSIKITPVPGASGNQGPFNTTALASGKSADGTTTNDDAVDGTDPDSGGTQGTPINGDNNPNNNSGPTVVSLNEAPKLGVALAASAPLASPGQPGFADVVFTVKLKNFGDVKLNALQVQENLASAFSAATGFVVSSGAVVTGITGAGSATGAGAAFTGKAGGLDLLLPGATLEPGAQATLSFTARVQAGANLRYQLNASGAGTSPAGTALTDLSTDGTNPDANGNGDPSDDSQATPVVFTEHPLIGVAKRVVNQVVNADGSLTVVFEVLVKNYGDVPLSSAQINDDLGSAIPAAQARFVVLAPPVLDPNCVGLRSAGAAFTGQGSGAALLTLANTNTNSLAVGASCKLGYSIQVMPVPLAPGNQGPFNTAAVARGQSATGAVTTDDSVDGPDPDSGGSTGTPLNGDGNPNNNSGPTVLAMVVRPKIGVAKAVGTPINRGDGSFDVPYTVTVKNHGEVNLDHVQVASDLTNTFASALRFAVLSRGDAGSSLTANPGYQGTAAAPQLLAQTDRLLVGESKTIKFTVRFTPGPRTAAFASSAFASGSAPGGLVVNDSSVTGFNPDPDGDGDPGNNSSPTLLTLPQVGVANQWGKPTDNGDGSFMVPVTVTVSNMGAEDLLQLQVNNDLGASFAAPLRFVVQGPITASGGLLASPNYSGGGVNTGLLLPGQSLARGARATLGFVVRVSPQGQPGPFVNSATASGLGLLSALRSDDLSTDGADPDPDQNGNPNDNQVPSPVVFNFSPDLQLALRHSGNFTAGIPGQINIDVKNIGFGPTLGEITVVDTLPEGLGLLAASGEGWRCAAQGQAVQCANAAVLPVGQALPALALRLSVDPSLLPKDVNTLQVSHQARVAVANELRVNLGNNQAEDALTVNRPASLTGSVWLDLQQNRRRDPQDRPIVGWQVEVLDALAVKAAAQAARVQRAAAARTGAVRTGVAPAAAPAVLVATAVTDANGRYTVTGLAPGDYLVQFRDPNSGVLFGDPVNGEHGSPQVGSTLDPSRAALAVSLGAGDNRIEQSLPIDPSGAVYDSVTRQPVAGAVVVLSAAAACGFDPALHLVGTQSYTVDAGTAAMTVGALGVYQFLLNGDAPSCVYALKVTPPQGYVASALIAPQPGVLTPPPSSAVYPVQAQVEPPQPGQATTYFTQLKLVAGSLGVVHNHIPLDPNVRVDLIVQGSVQPTVAELGDSVAYTLKVKNGSSTALPAVVQSTRLPTGFHYIVGSSRHNGVRVADPEGGVGPVLSYALGPLKAAEEKTLTFRARLAVGAQHGDGASLAQAASGVVRSNSARNVVQVQGGVFSDKAVVLGQVFAQCPGQGQNQGPSQSAPSAAALGIPGVRLVMEDGTSVVTDGQGKFSLVGLSARTHVLRLDTSTLPAGSQALPSQPDPAGQGDSRFLNLQFNGMGRADFAVNTCATTAQQDIGKRQARAEVLAAGAAAATAPNSVSAAQDSAAQDSAPPATTELPPLLGVGVVEARLNLRKLNNAAVQATHSNDGFDEELRLFSHTSSDGKTDVAARAAFFLKGKIRGDQLLTVAYDSDKASRERLFRDIQPEQFYPVYGDSSVRAFDAQSSQRLYLRVDDGKSYLLYGDISTQPADATRSLGHYQRSFTGVQEHFENDNVKFNAYVSRDAQKQVIDEFPARGISGPYSVSNPNGLSNSERVEIITRDRNQPAVILKTQAMARFVDYEFEPFSGRLLFKAPVPSLDASFNPVSVRVTYEVDQGGQKFWMGAMDAQFKLGAGLEIGGSWVEDHNPLAPYQLRSMNASAQLGEHTKLLAEMAQSDSQGTAADGGLAQGKGQAKRIELLHSDADLNLHLHAGKTDASFNNPAATLNGGRTEAGGKALVQIDARNRVSAELLHSEDSASQGRRQGASLAFEHDLNDSVKLQLGLRQAKETAQPAQASSVGLVALNQPGIGAELGNPARITLSAPPTANGNTALDNTTARARLSAKLPEAAASVYAEYEQDLHHAAQQAAAVGGEVSLAERARLYARHEFISSLSGVYGLNSAQQQRATVLGVDTATPADGQLFSEYRLRDALAGRDAEAALGLRNQWRWAPGLRLSTGFERVQTLAGTAHTASAVTGGIDYTADPLWKGSARLELRHDGVADTWLSTLSAARKLDEDWTLLARNLLSLADNKTQGDKLQDRFQVGAAYRDSVSRGSNALARYEYRLERDGSDLAALSKRQVHVVSAHADRQLSAPWLVQGHYAGKSLTERSLGLQSHYTAHELGARTSYDINDGWDLGLAARMLFSAGGRSRQQGLGAETGLRLQRNLWLSLGYNFSGYSDKDLEGSDSTSKGVFVRLRFKFDERLFSAGD